MSRRWLSSALVATVLGSSAPAVAEDLVYVYRNKHVAPLRQYNRQPYSKLLAECAGTYGSLVARYEAAGQTARADAAKAQGIAFANKAAAQLAQDRGLNQKDALQLIAADVETGRAAGEGLFRQPPPRDLSHEQVLDLFCSQIDEAYASAKRFR